MSMFSHLFRKELEEMAPPVAFFFNKLPNTPPINTVVWKTTWST